MSAYTPRYQYAKESGGPGSHPGFKTLEKALVIGREAGPQVTCIAGNVAGHHERKHLLSRAADGRW